ncbi:MAG: DNA gyrase subunit A, partial [Chloroflexi bacterium]|nr:DNA gyrase subunit A [Chloroflexota bacterium]
LDEVQAQAILDMQLRRIAALERERLETEYQELQKTIAGLEELLADPAKVMAEVKTETLELKKVFGQKRLTVVTDYAYDFDRKELEAHESIVITLSEGGYIKRIPANTYRSQHRGGKGVVSMNTKDDDPVRHILVVDTHDKLLFFTNTGRVLALTSYELRPDTSRNTRGVPIVNVVPLTDTERVNAVFEVADLEQEDIFLVMATRKGRIARLRLSAISSIRPSGLIMMRLKSDDELVAVRLAKEEEDIIMVSQQGMSIRFPVAEVTPHHRGAGGVRGMGLRSKDRVISMDVGGPDSRLLVISRLGYGKLTPLSKYRRQGRGGFGIKTFNITRKTGKVAAAQVVVDSKEVYVLSEQAQVLRTNLSEIRSIGRITQGVTIFKPQPGDGVSSIACVRDLDGDNAPTEAMKGRTNGKGAGQMPLKGLT